MLARSFVPVVRSLCVKPCTHIRIARAPIPLRLLHSDKRETSRPSWSVPDVHLSQSKRIDDKELWSESIAGKSFVPKTPGDYITHDVGVARFMARVHATSGVAFGSSLAVAYAFNWSASAGFFETLPTLGVSLIGALGSLAWFNSSSYQVVTTYERADGSKNDCPTDGVAMVPIYKSVNSTSRKAAFLSFLAFESLALTPAVDMANQINPVLVPVAAGLTALVMGGATLYSYRATPAQMATWHGPLFGGLWGLIGMSLVGIGSHLVIGPNVFSQLLFTAEPYVGIVLFTALTASDTYQAISAYKAKQPDHLEAAVQLYLNAINLFLRILRLLRAR